MAADIGTLSRFPKIVGNQSAVKELIFTGRTFEAKEAKELGFVSRVVDGGMEEVLGKLNDAHLLATVLPVSFPAATLQVARIISTKSPIAIMGSKHLLAHARDNTLVLSHRRPV